MITVYGAAWCEDTRRSLRQLRRLGVRHTYHNVDEDLDALERAKELNSGTRRTPTIELDGEVLVEPPNETLKNALIRHAEITDEEIRERRDVQNVGDLERVLRSGSGLVALLVAARAPRGLRSVLVGLGAINLLTGITGWCPAYALAGVSSVEGPGDHPREAERDRWLVDVNE